MDIKPRGKSHGLFHEIDIRSYIPGGVFREAEFRDSLKRENWSRFEGKRILVKGCGKGPVPPWAYMLLLSNLGSFPLMVAYGDDCSPIVVHRRKESTEEDLEAAETEAMLSV